MTESADPIWIKLVIPVLTAVCGALGALVVAQYQSSRSSRRQRAAEQAAVQFAYIDPLRMAAENLAWKFYGIEKKVEKREAGSGGLEWMRQVFHCVKEPGEILGGRNPTFTEYGYWCNGEGFFAVSTIYATAVYFLHARRTRRACSKEVELMRRLEGVRIALGHEFGIYVMLQDSVGEYVEDEQGMEIGYRRFCAKLYSEEDRAWFLNVLDYYREIDEKTVEQRRVIMTALRDLLTCLEHTTGIAVRDPFVTDPAVLG